MRLKILVACEFSGIYRNAFAVLGHDAWSCDLLDTEIPGQHHVGDVTEFLYDQKWDLLVAHPPCTYLCNSGVRWLYGGKGKSRDLKRWNAMEDAADFFRAFWDAPVPCIAIENPTMHRYGREAIWNDDERPTPHTVQPWNFGIREMKATCWWLKGLPPLVATNNVGPPPKDPELRKHWAKVHRASPGPNRWKDRSRSYPGMAAAAAMQWAGPA